MKNLLINQIQKVATETISDALSETKAEFQKHNTKQNDEISKLHDKCDELEQYSKRNCLVVHGLAEYQNENTDLMIKNFLWDMLEVDVDEMDIDRSHRLKRANDLNSVYVNPRPVIIKFVQHNLKQYVYSEKRKLKGTKFLITEFLTARRLKIVRDLKELRTKKQVYSYRTLDEKFFCKKSKDETIMQINSVSDLVL